MKKLKKFFEDHPNAVRYLHLGYIAFVACFLFPLYNERFKMDSMKIYLFLISYGIIGFEFFKIYGKGKMKLVYFLSFGLAPVGLILRYLIEFGEKSNLYNFNMENTLVFLLMAPAYTLLVYFITGKRVEKLEKPKD